VGLKSGVHLICVLGTSLGGIMIRLGKGGFWFLRADRVSSLVFSTTVGKLGGKARQQDRTNFVCPSLGHVGLGQQSGEHL